MPDPLSARQGPYPAFFDVRAAPEIDLCDPFERSSQSGCPATTETTGAGRVPPAPGPARSAGRVIEPEADPAHRRPIRWPEAR